MSLCALCLLGYNIKFNVFSAFVAVQQLCMKGYRDFATPSRLVLSSNPPPPPQKKNPAFQPGVKTIIQCSNIVLYTPIQNRILMLSLEVMITQSQS